MFVLFFMEKKLKILAAGDLHGDIDTAKRLSGRAKRESVDLIVLTGDIRGFANDEMKVLTPFLKANQKVVFISGNWDSFGEHYFIGNNIKSIHKRYVVYNNVGILGIGSPDWKLSLDPFDLKEIKNNFKKMKSKKKVLVSHLHARRTRAEFSGFAGDKFLRDAIDELKPDLFISSHIHEAEGIEEKIGKTKVIQVGRKGKIIEI